MRQVGIYKTSLYPIGKDATIKDLKLEILTYFDSPKTKHWTPVHQTPNIFLIPLSNGAIFAALEALGGGLQMFLELEKQRKMV